MEQNGSTQIVYAPTGQKFALMNGQTVAKAFVPLPAGAQAVYSGTTLAYFRHPDWLGSSRLSTTPSRTVYSSLAYAPFGETYAESGTPDRSFTGQNQDTIPGSTAGLYDFLFRQHAQYGRWTSPDPAGTAAADPTAPQTWNRYAYVLNNPLNAVDPLGLDCVYLNDAGDGVESIDHMNTNGGECWSNGGYWADGWVGGKDWVTTDPNSNNIWITSSINGFLGSTYAGSNVNGGPAFSQGPFGFSDPSSVFTTYQPTPIGNQQPGGGGQEPSPSSQAAMVALHNAFAKFPNICSVGVNATVGGNRVRFGVDANTANGVRPMGKISFPLGENGGWSVNITNGPQPIGKVSLRAGPVVVGTNGSGITGVGVTRNFGIAQVTAYGDVGSFYQCKQ